MNKLKIISFGCRVNAAESNQFAEKFIQNKDQTPTIFVNTCAITQKGEYESLARIRVLSKQYPTHQIIVAGCADLSKVSQLPNVVLYNKEKLTPGYSPKVNDKFTKSKKFLLKIQSGCSQNCTFCIVPQRRPKLWSLDIDQAVKTINQATTDGYQQLIITGVNIAQYQPNFNRLLSKIIRQTNIPLISFGSLPLICVNKEFMDIILTNSTRFSSFLHIPIQSGSDKILKLMHRPYSKQMIIDTFKALKSLPLSLHFGTDIIVGFPNESDQDFKETYDICQTIGFSKIHTFRFSPRPGTAATTLFDQLAKIPQSISKERSAKIRSLISQTTPPSRQTLEN